MLGFLAHDERVPEHPAPGHAGLLSRGRRQTAACGIAGKRPRARPVGRRDPGMGAGTKDREPPVLDGDRRSRGRESHPGGPARLGTRPVAEGAAGRAVQRDGRDGRPGRRPVVPPGLVLESLHEVRAHRWVPYGAAACSKSGANATRLIHRCVRVTLHHSQAEDLRARPQGAWSSRGPPGSPSRRSNRSRPPRSTLAHPARASSPPSASTASMAVPRPAHAGADRGRAGEPGRHLGDDRRASARRARCGRARPPAFHTDPIVLDTFTHLLGCWGLDCLEQGDVIFPLRMGRLSIHGDPAATGTTSTCRIRDPRGRAAPGPRRCRDRPARRPRLDADRRLGRLAVPLARRGIATCSGRPTRSSSARSCRFPACPAARRRRLARAAGRHGPAGLAGRPGADPARPRGTGRRACALGGPEVRRTHRLWGRIAAKEAARRIWLAAGDPPRYPADLAIDRRPGRPTPAPRPGSSPSEPTCRPSRSPTPRASPSPWRARDPDARAGIDVEPVVERPSEFEALALAGRARLRWLPIRCRRRRERVDRPVLGGQAGGRQGDGLGLAGRPGCAEVVDGRGRDRRGRRRVPRRPRIEPPVSPGDRSGSGRRGGASTSGPGPWEKR